MNVYKISYHVAGLGDTSTEARGRNEAEAKRNFKATEIGKAVPRSSISVEVIRENDLATKQEERDTLAAIRKMVEELGPQSYLATAFEGCFEDAESNIENDFGDSMKARWLHADAQLNAANGTIEELRERLSESEKDYEAAHAAAMRSPTRKTQKSRPSASASSPRTTSPMLSSSSPKSGWPSTQRSRTPQSGLSRRRRSRRAQHSRARSKTTAQRNPIWTSTRLSWSGWSRHGENNFFTTQ